MRHVDCFQRLGLEQEQGGAAVSEPPARQGAFRRFWTFDFMSAHQYLAATTVSNGAIVSDDVRAIRRKADECDSCSGGHFPQAVLGRSIVHGEFSVSHQTRDGDQRRVRCCIEHDGARP